MPRSYEMKIMLKHFLLPLRSSRDRTIDENGQIKRVNYEHFENEIPTEGASAQFADAGIWLH